MECYPAEGMCADLFAVLFSCHTSIDMHAGPSSRRATGTIALKDEGLGLTYPRNQEEWRTQ